MKKTVFQVVILAIVALALSACAIGGKKGGVESYAPQNLEIQVPETSKQEPAAWSPLTVSGGEVVGETRTYFFLADSTTTVVEGGFVPFDAIGIVAEFRFHEPVGVQFQPIPDLVPGPVLKQEGRRREFKTFLNFNTLKIEKSFSVSGVILQGSRKGEKFHTQTITFLGREKL